MRTQGGCAGSAGGQGPDNSGPAPRRAEVGGPPLRAGAGARRPAPFGRGGGLGSAAGGTAGALRACSPLMADSLRTEGQCGIVIIWRMQGACFATWQTESQGSIYRPESRRRGVCRDIARHAPAFVDVVLK